MTAEGGSTGRARAAEETREQIVQRTYRIVERSKQLAVLNAIASSVSQSLDFQYTLNTAVQQVPHLMGFEAGAVFLKDKITGELRLETHHGLSQTLVTAIERLSADEELIGSVARTGEPLIGEVPRNSTSTLSQHLWREGFWFFVAIPLKAKASTLGLMVLASHGPRHLNPNSGQFLIAIGDVIGMAVENASLYRDVAELLEETRLQAERLRESERQFRTLIESAADAVAIIQDDRFQYLNPYGMEMLGYLPEELQDLHFLDVVHPDYREAVAQTHARRLQNETIPPYDILVVRKDGTEMLLSLNACLIEYGGRAATLIIARDITESRRLREQILQAEKMAALGQLIAGVAHELNNPLTTLIGYSELLRLEDSLPGSVQQGLDAMFEAALRASRIVKNLLTFARQQGGHKSQVDINDLIEHTLALRAYQLHVNNIAVVKEYAANLPTTLADPTQLQQVIFNLIINAEHAMLEAHGRGQLVIRTRVLIRRPRQRSLADSPHPAAHDMIEIAFIDDGPGIPAVNLHRLFEPFFTTKAVGQGTGLGLSISHGIIHDHGGRIYARSQFGQGATFIVELPVVHQRPSPAAGSPELPLPEKVTAKRILIVDDEPTIVNLVQKIIAAEGHQVETATSGREALAKLNQHPYDLIFCDMKMPDLSGRDLYHEVNRLNQALARRMVFVTGDVISHDTRAFFEQTGCVVIEKPFTNDDVIRVTRTLLTDQ
jgi:two-component system NtrC family sensor kinase